MSFDEFETDHAPVEDVVVRDLVDITLADLNQKSVPTVASTIFPASLWSPKDARSRLYARFDNIWPRISKERGNANGHYFRRLVAFGDDSSVQVNQLEHIITTFQVGNHRRSALIASIFDPTQDHSHQRQRGFPCLHQVCFGHSTAGLSVTGFYALQHIVTKGYGNYLGLARLGQFLAHELGLSLAKVSCVAAAGNLGNNVSKRAVGPLVDALRTRLNLSC